MVRAKEFQTEFPLPFFLCQKTKPGIDDIHRVRDFGPIVPNTPLNVSFAPPFIHDLNGLRLLVVRRENVDTQGVHIIWTSSEEISGIAVAKRRGLFESDNILRLCQREQVSHSKVQ